MKRLTTADATVRLIKICYVLVFSLVIILLLGKVSVGEVSAAGMDRGYLTSSSELAYIRQQYQARVEPFYSRVNNFLANISAPSAWAYDAAGSVYNVVDADCVSSTGDPTGLFMHQRGGAQGVYEKMIAYYLTGNIEYATVARQKILDFTRATNFGGNLYSGNNQCILELSWGIPLWIQAADLLEPTSIWTVNDKRAFQNFLAVQVYPKVAWASAYRRNNWGAAGSLAASMIGDYLWDYPVSLTEVQPVARTLNPAQAFAQANANQLARMNTSWKGDGDCTIYGIRSHGGIPDELRRGTTGCDGQWIASGDSSLTYQITHVEQMVFHAEYLSRRGNFTIYNNMATDGTGSLLKAILFVIANPVNGTYSYDWTTSKRGVLFVANTRYRNNSITAELTPSTTVRRGSLVAFAELTHVIDIGASQPLPTPMPTTVASSTPRPTNTVAPTTVAPTTVAPTAIATLPTGGTTTLVLNPIADSLVLNDQPSTNFGTSTSLRVDNSPISRSYLRFSVPAVNGTVIRATLRFYMQNSAPLGYNVHTTSNTWTEATITFNNAPTFGPVLISSLPSASGVWTEVILPNVVTGSGTYNLVLTTPSNSSTGIASRESTSTRRPQLVLTISSGSGVPTTVPSSTPRPTNTVAPTSVVPTTVPSSTPLPTAIPTLPSGSTTIVLNPVADTYVSSEEPDRNFGASSGLRVDNSPTARSYIRFTVPPVNGTIVSATLRLYVKNNMPNGYSVHTTSNNTWSETGITFNNAPAFSSVIVTSLATSSAGWVQVALPNVVRGSGNYNLILTTPSTTATGIGSRESSTKPELVLVIASTNTSIVGGGSMTGESRSSDASIGLPTIAPTQTLTPTIVTTTVPTIVPTNTEMPTLVPATETAIPTVMPTNTEMPTMVPTAMPSEMPTAIPTVVPAEPVVEPTQTP
jgi:hypothetical protein